MSDNPESTPAQVWDPRLYDNQHAFVWHHGESVLELLHPKPGERILDIGCGTGHLTARIAESGAEVIGLDSSAEMLQQARSAHPHLQFVLGDARDFTFPQPFDAIFSNAALHWIKEPRDVIRSVHAALKPDGRFVAELGGRGNVQTIAHALRLVAARMQLPVGESPWFFPGVADYSAILEEAGLEVRLALLFDRPTPLAGASGLRDWVKMFARGRLDAFPPDRHEEFLSAVEEETRPVLFREGGWFADYRRLRIVAVRTDSLRQPARED